MGAKSKIVNLSGTFENGGKGWLPYYASKRALEDLTIGLAQELEERSIQVNAVSPSDTATESYSKYFPQYMDEAISPEKIAEKIVELCQEENIITGKVIVMKSGTEPFEGFHS
jgi:NAD(P)-dependent dehydrogenase (short-subunit alcohol dehydrogenase family)